MTDQVRSFFFYFFCIRIYYKIHFFLIFASKIVYLFVLLYGDYILLIYYKKNTHFRLNICIFQLFFVPLHRHLKTTTKNK